MDKENFETDVLISTLIIKIASIEKLLISKGLIKEDELAKEIYDMSVSIAKSILKKSNSPNADAVLSTILNSIKNKNN